MVPGRKPDICNMKIFGYLIRVTVSKERTEKLDKVVWKMRYMGHGSKCIPRAFNPDDE